MTERYFWLCPTTRYVVVETVRAGKDDKLVMVEIHHYETPTAPTRIELISSQGIHESESCLWDRAIDSLLSFKRLMPFSPSVVDHGRCVLHFAPASRKPIEERMAEVFEHVAYMNQRHALLWSARPDQPRPIRRKALSAIRRMCEDECVEPLARVIANLDLAQLQRFIPARDYQRLNSVVEYERLKTLPTNWQAHMRALAPEIAIQAVHAIDPQGFGL
ncbi:hypothetical protein [Pseudomonas chlororaphis]|uniref:hypothetical protein n=1 Tax=Pseudomonas chlororaphis TaxID=587753 RepID=UPI0014763E9F|nr:hypothetical protein [Pseudomonas chlororaphis]NNB47604.1 hypothetical protein [Pseudomonas chlororaphis]